MNPGKSLQIALKQLQLNDVQSGGQADKCVADSMAGLVTSNDASLPPHLHAPETLAGLRRSRIPSMDAIGVNAD
jgi:hypothetical protein